MKKILAIFLLAFVFIGVATSFQIRNCIYDLSMCLTEKYCANNHHNRNEKNITPFNMLRGVEKETVILRLMQYNIGIFNFGIKTPSRDAGLRENEYEEKLNNYKEFFCKYQPDIIGFEEIIRYIDHDELHLTNDVLFNPIYPYKYDVFSYERSIKSKYPITPIGDYWLSTTISGTEYKTRVFHAQVSVSKKVVNILVCAMPPSADVVHKKARANIFPQLLSLLEDAEYGFIILDMNNSGNGSTITSQDEGEELLAVAKASGFNFANGGGKPWKDTYDDVSRGRPVKFSPIDNIIYKDNGKIVFNDFQVMSDESGKLTSDHWPVYADFVLF